jgi:hypothetical protein
VEDCISFAFNYITSSCSPNTALPCPGPLRLNFTRRSYPSTFFVMTNVYIYRHASWSRSLRLCEIVPFSYMPYSHRLGTTAQYYERRGKSVNLLRLGHSCSNLSVQHKDWQQLQKRSQSTRARFNSGRPHISSGIPIVLFKSLSCSTNSLNDTQFAYSCGMLPVKKLF